MVILNHLNKVSACLFFFVLSCGPQIEFPLFRDANPLEHIVFNSEDENPRQEYLVAFRAFSNSHLDKLNSSKNYILRRLTHNKSLYHNFVETGEIENIEFIAQINLAMPEKNPQTFSKG